MNTKQITHLADQLHPAQCPSCKSTSFIKNGKENGNQRYKCKTCSKGFRSTTGTSIHHIHMKSKIHRYIQCLNEGLTLRKTAKRIGISLTTAFNWRHKLLKTLNKKNRTTLIGQKHLSALSVPFSHKGSPKPKHTETNVSSIIQSDFQGNLHIEILGKYGYSKNLICTKLEQSHSYSANRSLPRMITDQIPQNKSTLKSGQIHNDLTAWLAKFKGVATKYLANYWVWYSTVNFFEIENNQTNKMMNLCI